MDDLLSPTPLRVYVACCAVHDSRKPVTIENVQARLPDEDPATVLEAMYELADKGLIAMEWRPLYRFEWVNRPTSARAVAASS